MEENKQLEAMARKLKMKDRRHGLEKTKTKLKKLTKDIGLKKLRKN